MFRPPRDGDDPIFVSGAGDGGLLEALRLCHTEFGSGRLIIEAAQRLEGGSALERIEAGEARIRHAAMARNRPGKGYLDDSMAVAERRDLYQSVLDSSVSDAFLNRLGEDLAERKPAVYLICEQDHPYRREVAPIHKLLLAHAIREKRIEHVKARIDKRGNLSPPQPTIPFNKRRTILRHGAGFSLGLLDDGEADKISSRQGEHIDKFDQQLWRPEDFTNSHPKEGADREKFVAAHARRAGRLNDIQAGVSVSLLKGDTQFYFFLTGDKKLLQQRPLPDTLFGIPLREREMPAIESLARPRA